MAGSVGVALEREAINTTSNSAENHKGTAVHAKKFNGICLFLSPPSTLQPLLLSPSIAKPPTQNNNKKRKKKMGEGGEEINPSILLIIVILSAIFFISGLLHLLVRLLLKPAGGAADDRDGATALQGQLQQLFHLHDAGVDQSYIDTLPVFVYKTLIGGKDPFDCAVCLCEFDPDDKLRLLPACSHAFHLPCIDTWLLSHSTCPLCRCPLLSAAAESPPPPPPAADAGPSLAAPPQIVPVKLGNFRGGGEGSSAGGNLDGRRCFSMGACEYVTDERLRLKVEIPAAPPESRWRSMRAAALTGGSQRAESFSVSRIWRRLRREREAVSFRLPAAEDGKGGDGNSCDGAGEVVSDVEGGAVSETPSFARRSLRWIVGRGSRRIVDRE
ncbi:RING-H2 finger protein ATL13-like [Wolffia australiana]